MPVKKRTSYKLPEKEKNRFLINNLNDTGGLNSNNGWKPQDTGALPSKLNKSPFNLEFYTQLYYLSNKKRE